MRAYLHARPEDFENRIKAVTYLEHQADDLRRQTKIALYAHSLIPESRGDVLGLLEHMDDIADEAKAILRDIEVQSPEIPADLAELFLEVTDKSVEAVDNVVLAARCYFRDPKKISAYINKVDFFESETDRAGLMLRKKIFRSDIDLARKLHLRYFADLLESLSDIAQNVAERLTIATIKREV